MNSVFGEGSVEQDIIHEQGRRPINCDQVSWLLTSIESYIPDKCGRGVSREREMKKYALLYEIMDLANLHFEDDAAQRNGTPPDVTRFRFASKSEELELLVNTPCPKADEDSGLNPLKQEGAPVHPAEMNFPMSEEFYQKQLKRYTDWYELDEAKK